MIYTGYTGTQVEIEADNLDEAYAKLANGQYREVEVESWIEDGDDTYETSYSPKAE